MKRFILACLFSLMIFASAFSQQAEKIDEIGFLPCSEFINRIPVSFSGLEKSSDSKICVIYYEGKVFEAVWDSEKRKNKNVLIDPKRGYALNRAKEILIFSREKEYSSIQKRIFLINGGFRKEFSLEIWLVPQNSTVPKPSSTILENEISFTKGKPQQIRQCARIYDGL